MRRAVQREATLLPEHLLLQFDYVVADVGHHQQEEVEGARWTLETEEEDWLVNRVFKVSKHTCSKGRDS